MTDRHDVRAAYDEIAADYDERRADERLSDVPLVQGDMTDLPFEIDSFEGITSIYAMIHVPSAYHEQTVSEFARVLRPQGQLLVTVGIEDWQGTTEDWQGFGTAMHWDMPGLERITDLLTDAGFSVMGWTRVRDDTGEESGYKPFVTARFR